MGSKFASYNSTRNKIYKPISILNLIKPLVPNPVLIKKVGHCLLEPFSSLLCWWEFADNHSSNNHFINWANSINYLDSKPRSSFRTGWIDLTQQNLIDHTWFGFISGHYRLLKINLSRWVCTFLEAHFSVHAWKWVTHT